MKNILVVMVLGIFLLSCSNIEKEKTITVEKIEIPYSMVEQSIRLDDSISLELFLENGFDPNYITEDGETLLMKIVKDNSLKSLKMLTSYDVNLEKETIVKRRKNTTSYNSTKRAIDFVNSKKALNILMDAGVDIDYIDNLGDPLIIKFIKNKPNSYTEKLILESVNIDQKGKENWTPLMWATARKNTEIVRVLLENHADINLTDERKNPAIYYAYDEKTILMFLVENLNIYYKNKDGENILGEVYLRSISNSYYNAVKKIVEIGEDKNYASYGDTPLGIARENKDEKMIKLLKELGVEE